MTLPPRSTSDLIAVLHQDAHNVADPETFFRALTAQATARRRPGSTQRWLLPAVAAAAAAAIALVAVWVAAGRESRPLAPAEPKPTATPQGATLNRQLTTAETIRLVGLVNLPPASAPTTVRPSSLGGPAGGTPLSSSLIDTVRYWRVPLSYPQAVSWMAAHPPAGLRLSGTSGPTGTAKQFSGYVFDVASSSAWQAAELDIGILPASPSTTFWRVDGMALWLDPRPVRDTGSGPRLHVTVAGGCPSSDRGTIGVSNTAAGLVTSLLPPGSPSAALLCGYSGINGRAFALISHRLLSAAEANRLAVLARAVSLAHSDSGPISCPVMSGGVTVIAFRFPGGSNIALWFLPGACGYLSNGAIIADSFINPSTGDFQLAIQALTG